MSTSTLARASVASAPRSTRRWLALTVLALAQFLVILDASIVNIALPVLGRQLRMDTAALSWVITAYVLAFGGLLLLGGRLGDLYGRRRLFMIGVTIFALASGLGGFAQSELMLLGSRALQGLGAAIASPTALALITTTFPSGPRRNRAFSVYAAMSGVGAAVGLLLGGWLTGLHPHLLGFAVDGWRLTFLINVPIGLMAAYFAPRVLAESESHPGQLDLPGALSGTLGLVSLVYGITRAGDIRYGWGDPWTMIWMGLGVALLLAFVVIERRVSHPLLPLRILRNRTRATAFVAMMIVPAAMFAMFFFLSLFVQNVMGYSPLRTGLAFAPFSVGMVVSATLASRLINRVDPRFIAGIGTILSGVALFMFHRLSVDSSVPALISAAGHGTAYLGTNVNYWTDLFPWIILMALGMGATFVPMTLSAVHGVRREDSGVGSGVLNTMQQIGGALGLATLSTIAVHYSSSLTKDIVGQLSTAAHTGPASAGTQAALTHLVGQGAFANGATHAFLTGAFMMWGASVVVWVFLSVRHRELAAGEVPEAVAVA